MRDVRIAQIIFDAYRRRYKTTAAVAFEITLSRLRQRRICNTENLRCRFSTGLIYREPNEKFQPRDNAIIDGCDVDNVDTQIVQLFVDRELARGASTSEAWSEAQTQLRRIVVIPWGELYFDEVTRTVRVASAAEHV